jgi:hypothetical protein
MVGVNNRALNKVFLSRTKYIFPKRLNENEKTFFCLPLSWSWWYCEAHNWDLPHIYPFSDKTWELTASMNNFKTMKKYPEYYFFVLRNKQGTKYLQVLGTVEKSQLKIFSFLLLKPIWAVPTHKINVILVVKF